MINWALRAIFGTKSARDIKKLTPLVEQVNQLEKDLMALSDEDILARSLVLKGRVQVEVDVFYKEYEVIKRKERDYVDRMKEAQEDLKKKKQAVLNTVLVEAFALAREAGKRVLNMRHYDVQLMGGAILHQGKIAEMTTGEGKTLVATLPVYLNALSGRGVHVVTVNDYLAKRDCKWMGPLYEFLGLTVGVIVHDMDANARQEAYACDITYGTNNEFGFDYLRDNMVLSKKEQAQRPLNFCIVDEVDSILIDEARTPLIISGPVDTVSHCYAEVKSMVRDVVVKQTVLIESFYKDLDAVVDGSDDDALAEWLYVIHRGAPKDPSFLLRISQCPELKRKLESALTLYGSKERAKVRVELEEKLFFIYDEKSREVTLTAAGQDLLSKDFSSQFELEDITEIISEIQLDESLSMGEKSLKEHEAYKSYQDKGKRIRSFEQLLKAYVLFHLDVDYVVDDDKVVIVDEFTGRMMPGRRFSDGLHEALEAKEGVKIQRESQTLATITFQNYFRMYHKLAGMTGTADTEAGEFHEIYKLDVVVAPTNRPIKRNNCPDVIYKTSSERFGAIVNEIETLHREGRPVLVGTVSIEKSEEVAALLQRKKIIHEVLNAKNHAREAEIISLAGQAGAVTEYGWAWN
jgi:preprotein translocase subunit SecA